MLYSCGRLNSATHSASLLPGVELDTSLGEGGRGDNVGTTGISSRKGKNIPIFLLDSRHRIRSYVINKLLASVPGERLENRRIIIRRRMLERLS